jgi:ribulose-phosphate 3-epimerase
MNTEATCIVAPSLLAADFSHIRDAVVDIEKSAAQWVHFDVMDGNFVPNITFGAKFVSDLRPHSDLVFDTHLMVSQPERFITQFAEAGSDYITVHAEATMHLFRTLTMIREAGKKVGVSIVPSTPISMLDLVLDQVDMVMLMTVNPGFGGQTFIPISFQKIEQLAQVRKERNLNFLISVDGGVNRSNVASLVHSGVDVLVMGSAFFGDPDQSTLVSELQRLSR